MFLTFHLSIDKTSCGTYKSYNECKNHNFPVARILSSWLVSFNVSTFVLVFLQIKFVSYLCFAARNNIGVVIALWSPIILVWVYDILYLYPILNISSIIV